MSTRRSIFFRSALAGFFCLLFIGPNWGQNNTPENPRSAIIAGKTAQTLFLQCSRPSPKEVDGYWTATTASTNAADKSLPAYLKTQKSPSRVGAQNLDEYYHQYVGFTRKGHKFLYLNAFSPVTKRDMDNIAKYTKKKTDWKREPVSVCDGGSLFFGAEYDVETGKWSLLYFNGFG